MTNETNPIISSIGKVIEKNPQIYEDALKPTAVETGKLAGRIPRTINAIFAGLDKWILKRESHTALKKPKNFLNKSYKI